MKLPRIIQFVAAWLGFVAMGYGLTLMFVDRPPSGSTDATQVNDSQGVDVNTINIELENLEGTAQRLSAWQGKPLVVNFWATWCAPCRKEIPLLKALQDEFAGDELTVVGVAIDEMDAVKSYAEEAAFNYPILVGEDKGVQMASAIGVDNLYVPITAFVDRSGRVTRIHTGEIHREDALLAIGEIVAR
ncbi:MAG: TlpA disulfide reductase family protein [Gammaproteobacteria bacterium]